MSRFASLSLGLIGLLGAVAVTVYFVAGLLKKSMDPGALVLKWIITVGTFIFWIYLGTIAQGFNAFVVIPAGALSGILLGIIWAPHIADIISSPITSWYDGGDVEPELRPLYSMATAYRKRGNYDKAVVEIRRQLANFPTDFEGWMMMAEIQFKDLADLSAALRTVENILTFPELAPKNAAYALGRVADWQLDRGDRDAAREALERVMARMPNSPEAQVAAQRIAHLASAEHLAEMHDPRVLALKHSDERIGLRGETVGPPAPEDANATAQRYVDHLQQYPLDNEIREKLANLYAGEFKRLDLAAAELEQLISTPHQTPKNVAHWLNLLADFQIRLANDVDLARETLRRIIELYPSSGAASTANVRMSQLRLELNQNSVQKTLKLGNYEQNIGLKRMTSGGTNET